MRLNTLLTLSAIGWLVGAVAFGLFPAQLFALFGGAPPDGRLLFMTRLVGAMVVGYALLGWFARKTSDLAAQKAVSLSFLGATATSCVVFLVAMVSGPTVAGAVIVAIGGSFAAGFAYFALKPNWD